MIMKKLLFLILLFAFFVASGQDTTKFTGTIINNCTFSGTIVTTTPSWTNKMMRSYLKINSHTDFTFEDKIDIYNRLYEPYVQTTFGPSGTNEDSADFFIFLKTYKINDTLTEWENRKSGDVMRWNLGNGKIYNQNNTPNDTSDGIVTITSTDYFDGVDTFDIRTDSFYGPLFNLGYYMPNVDLLAVGSNYFSGNVPSLPNGAPQGTFVMGPNSFTGDIPDLTNLTNLYKLLLYQTFGLKNANKPGITGSVNDLMGGSIFRQLLLFENAITELQTEIFSTTLENFNVRDNEIPEEEIDSCLMNVVDWFKINRPRRDCEFDFTGLLNGYLPEDTATWDTWQSIDSMWVGQGKVADIIYNIYPGALDSAYVMFTFDDGLKNVYDVAFPLFEEKGIAGTAYITADWVNGETTYDEPGMSWSEIIELYNSGWEIGSHSYHHWGYNDMDADSLHNELMRIDTAHTNNGLPIPNHFAYPWGVWDQQSKDSIRNYFNTARLVDSERYSGADTDSLELSGYWNEGTRTDTNFIFKMIDYIDNYDIALIFLNHAVAEEGSGPCGSEYGGNCIEYEVMEAIIDYIQSKNMRIATIEEFYSER